MENAQEKQVLKPILDLMTAKEKEVMKKCMREETSWFAISPTAVLSGMGGYGLGKFFKFQSPWKPAVGFACVGFIIARVQASQACLLKAIPQHEIKQRFDMAMMQQRGANFPQHQFDVSQKAEYEDTVNSYDTFTSADDAADIPSKLETDLTEPLDLRHRVSYDDLRKQNREQHQRRVQGYGPPPKRSWEPPKEERESDNEYELFDSNTSSRDGREYRDVWN